VSIANEIFPGDAGHAAGPYGLGIRVPMIVVSPWSKGGWVNSQLFDHTSLVRFLEARFADGRPDLVESNITPWRRAVVGDLTTAFDFRLPAHGKSVALPGTDAYKPVDLVRVPDEEPVPPAVGQLPRQERGVKPARALPYTLDAQARVLNGSVQISFSNHGQAGAVFQVRSEDGAQGPWTYTVEAHKQVTESWPLAGRYGVFVHGPNGFYRGFEGDTGAAQLDVSVQYQDAGRRVTLDISNPRPTVVEVQMVNVYDGHHRTIDVGPGATVSHSWTVTRSQGWYDIELTVTGDDGFRYQLAGHLENGDDSTTDPLMGGLV
jgi:phospholipase C